MTKIAQTRVALIAMLLVGACGGFRDQFVCQDTSQCASASGEGVCEPSGFCSFTDSSCDSGRRFGEHSGEASQQCVLGPDADIVKPPDAAIIDAMAPDAALPCDPAFVVSPVPLGTGQINQAAYSNPVPFVFIGMEITGPGMATLGELSITGSYTWSYPFTVSAPGQYQVQFTRDMGEVQATCLFVVADTGATPSL